MWNVKERKECNKNSSLRVRYKTHNQNIKRINTFFLEKCNFILFTFIDFIFILWEHGKNRNILKLTDFMLFVSSEVVYCSIYNISVLIKQC